MLSVVEKLFTHILDKGAQLFAKNILMESQFGFRQDRSTVDGIFVAWDVIEKCLEKEERVHWLYLDLKKAFDSVNCDAAWKLFGKRGMPGGFVDLLRSLHEGMQAKVRVGNNISNPFEISNGFRARLCVCLIWLYYTILSCHQALPGHVISIKYRLNGRLNNNRIKKWNITEIQELHFADDAGQPHRSAQQSRQKTKILTRE